jgi:hypothetical protein
LTSSGWQAAANITMARAAARTITTSVKQHLEVVLFFFEALSLPAVVSEPAPNRDPASCELHLNIVQRNPQILRYGFKIFIKTHPPGMLPHCQTTRIL